MKFGKPLIAASALAAALLLPATPAAAEPVTYNLSDGNVVISQNGEYVITQDDPNTPVTKTIEVKADVDATITLSGVNIEFDENDWHACAFKIEDNSTGDVTVVLAEGTANRLVSGPNAAGLQKNGAGENVGTLTITGNGSLYASTNNPSSFSAGIGSSVNNSTRNITIENGNIEAFGRRGAGIGAGSAYTQGSMTSATNIRINGGTVLVSASGLACGIGGADRFHGSLGAVSVFVTGGSVTDSSRYGIGSFRPVDPRIVITGGSVKSAAGFTTQPTDGEGNAVYLLKIDNQNSQPVTLDGESYLPVNQNASSPGDTSLYAYVTGESHVVKVGCTTTTWNFDNGSFTAGASSTEHTFSSAWQSNSANHWNICDACGDTVSEEHSLSAHHDETSHWQTCETCGYATDPEPHSFEWVVDREATATEAGSKHEECAACGYAKKAVEIPATGTTEDSSDNSTGSTQNPSTPNKENGKALPATSDSSAAIAAAAIAMGSILIAGGYALNRKSR
ncbi:hypothetical protein [Enorma phocaeensis]|uniref:Carbohydrate-binding domain-containing protein n=1 Tax=Enorma phocaeensis TaxID=1871019 RepID=A0A921IU04_9ACTN|nr:hypothetical protein [Enorma phocaeensis]HJG36656.1 carbohydrate-binding domain-containing protein [Enorma phocaeensis]